MTLPKWIRESVIRDATTSCTINIKTQDIDGAKPEDGSSCVAARSCQRAFDAEHVYVFRSTAYVQFDEGGPVERFTVPSDLRDNVVSPLDAGDWDNIKPGRYELKPPAPSQRRGEASRRRQSLKERRERGDAPPAKRNPDSKSRPLVGRVRTASAL